MTRAQYRQARRVVRMLVSFHRHPHDSREAATWAMHAAHSAGVTQPTQDDFRAFDKIGTAALQRRQ